MDGKNKFGSILTKSTPYRERVDLKIFLINSDNSLNNLLQNIL